MPTSHRTPSVLVVGVDSLRADHLSTYGYHRLTTPHLDRLALQGVVMEEHLSPSIPTTPGYASMLSGRDCFGTGVVELRHRGSLAPGVLTLAELLGVKGYETLCVGFSKNPASRGFATYLDFDGWKMDPDHFARKAERLNAVAVPEFRRLARTGRPFFLFLRHMDPHPPYLPPPPFERLFYGGNEKDPANRSMEPVFGFAPFADFFRSWMPEGVTDRHYIDAQYDGALSYLDTSLEELFQEMARLGLDEDTLVVVTSDHGESLYEHDCFYDHHGLYEPTLHVPLILRFPGRLPAGSRIRSYSSAKDVMPTILELLGLAPPDGVEGESLVPHWRDGARAKASEWYLTEATWMRKHGWRTAEWKLIEALEPDFHDKPTVELYHLSVDPTEQRNLAPESPEVLDYLQARMAAHIERREQETGRKNPITLATKWHGLERGPFTNSRDAYECLHIGSVVRARELQTEEKPNYKEPTS